MTARGDVERIFEEIFTALNENPIQQMNLLTGAEEANLNKANAHNRAVRESLLALADRLDRMESGK